MENYETAYSSLEVTNRRSYLDDCGVGGILGSYRLLNTQDNEAGAASQGKLSTALNRLMVILQPISTPKMSAARYRLEKM